MPGPILLLESTPVVPASSDSDREALVALYDTTGGEQWANSENWLSDRPPGEWHGVITDDDGRVVQIVLPDNGLIGELPAE